ncbi:MAG: hypothetical protein ACK4SY_09435 [Pyrobaculum sp.]
MYIVAKCPQCGVEFPPRESCPNGHQRPYVYEVAVSDCEIRDFERFSLLTHTVQTEVLSAVETGRGPSALYPIFVKLRDFGVLVCK